MFFSCFCSPHSVPLLCIHDVYMNVCVTRPVSVQAYLSLTPSLSLCLCIFFLSLVLYGFFVPLLLPCSHPLECVVLVNAVGKRASDELRKNEGTRENECTGDREKVCIFK